MAVPTLTPSSETSRIVLPTGSSPGDVRNNTELPFQINKELSSIPPFSFRKVRKLPSWGTIFSKHVCFVSPEGHEDKENFLLIVDSYLQILLKYLSCLEPEKPNSKSVIERLESQHVYCLQQKCNDKTRNVLAKAFDKKWADRYIEEVLFDCPSVI